MTLPLGSKDHPRHTHITLCMDAKGVITATHVEANKIFATFEASTDLQTVQAGASKALGGGTIASYCSSNSKLRDQLLKEIGCKTEVLCRRCTENAAKSGAKSDAIPVSPAQQSAAAAAE